jgi:hypothetical protein
VLDGTYGSLLDWPLPCQVYNVSRLYRLCELGRRSLNRALKSRSRQRTEDFLQLHDGGIGADAMDSLQRSGINVLLKHLAVGAMGAVITRHGG